MVWRPMPLRHTRYYLWEEPSCPAKRTLTSPNDFLERKSSRKQYSSVTRDFFFGDTASDPTNHGHSATGLRVHGCKTAVSVRSWGVFKVDCRDIGPLLV